MKKVNELYELIIEYGIASEETLEVITNINGYSIETLNDVIYCVTGYRNFKQLNEVNEGLKNMEGLK